MIGPLAGGALGPLAQGRRRGGGAPGGHLPQTDALIAAMETPPSEPRANLINQTISDLIDAGIWERADALWIVSSHHSQAARLNWINPASSMSLVGEPTFVVDRGYSSIASGNHCLDTNFNPSTDGVNYQADDAMLGVYIRGGGNGGGFDLGARESNSHALITVRIHTPTFRGPVNSSAVTVPSYGISPDDIRGFWTSQVLNGDRKQTKNGVTENTVTFAGNTTPNLTLAFGGENNSGVFSVGRNRSYGAAVAGGALTDAQDAALYSIIQNYMVAVGADV